jgi:serine/threonine protein kinase
LSDEGASIAMRGILNAVDYLHSQNYMHRDLKPQNILVPNPKDLSTIKLADFGLAGQFDNRVSVSDRKCGTLIFMAPEQIQNRVYSKSVDIWSCGIILYMLCNSGRHPLHSKNDNV